MKPIALCTHAPTKLTPRRNQWSVNILSTRAESCCGISYSIYSRLQQLLRPCVCVELRSTQLVNQNYVISYLREHTHAVLIIDDAHLLNTETLDRLFTLKHRIGLACPMSLGFILAGENTLKSTIADLEDTNPACTQVYQINVRPFSHEQTKNYIDHRLETAGLEGEILFDEAKITEIYKATSGNISQIHEQAIKELHNQCDEDYIDDYLDPHITIRRPKPKVPVLFLTLLALIGIGLFINYKFLGQNEDETIPLEKPVASEPTLSPIAQEIHKPDSQQTPSLPLPNAPKTNKQQIDIANIKDLATPDVKPINKDLPSLLAESIESFDETQLKGVEEKLTAKVEQVNKTDATTKIVNATQTTEQKPQQASKPNDKLTNSSATHGEAWLKAIDPSRYTIQVVATKDRKQLQALTKKESLTSEYAYFSKPVKGDTYYVLVIGDYKNREEAISAVNKLPASLRKNKPWPIPVKNAQKFLN